jgi:hypothetical protein
LQIKEFRVMGLSINDSVYSCLFFFLTGLHFFHLLLGVLLFCLLFWSCSFPFKMNSCVITLRKLRFNILQKITVEHPEIDNRSTVVGLSFRN